MCGIRSKVREDSKAIIMKLKLKNEIYKFVDNPPRVNTEELVNWLENVTQMYRSMLMTLLIESFLALQTQIQEQM